MTRYLIFSLILLSIQGVFAKANVHVQRSVPTSTPIPGDYRGSLRPQVHFSAPKGFINDPNGMFIDASGTYHLYYQYNPTELEAGNQHWGHVTSKDLYHWINQPIALFPLNATSLIFSGSAVVDVNNTSGFFPSQDNGVVALFTIATDQPDVALQSQGIAYSFDNGYTFEMFEGNPVLDAGVANFRDPKVIWYQDHWVMVVAYSDIFVIGIFTSPDLKTWTHASNFSGYGLLGQLWECPNMVEIPVEGTSDTMWVMIISVNPGAPLGGSITQFYPGTFDGYTFTPLDGVVRLTDFGKDNYAGQFFYGLPASANPISIAWASNWQYTNMVPTDGEGWRSTMGLPREQTLRRINDLDWALVSKPYDISAVKSQRLAKRLMHDGSLALDFGSVSSNAIYFEANATGIEEGWFNFTFSSPISGEYVQGGVAFGTLQPIWMNRGGLKGFDNAFFTDKFSSSSINGITQVEGVIDRSIFEVFANDGQLSATNTIFPEQPLTVLTLSVSNIVPKKGAVSVAVYGLRSTWKSSENSQGIVMGNVTEEERKRTVKVEREPTLLYHDEF